MQRFSKKASTAPPDSPEPTAMLEIIILQRFSVIVIFILTASLLQIHTDLLNFGSAARHYSLDYLYSITGPTKERMFFRLSKRFFQYFQILLTNEPVGISDRLKHALCFTVSNCFHSRIVFWYSIPKIRTITPNVPHESKKFRYFTLTQIIKPTLFIRQRLCNLFKKVRAPYI